MEKNIGSQSSQFHFQFPKDLKKYKKVQNIAEVMKYLEKDAKKDTDVIKNDFFSGKAVKTTPDGYKKYLYVHCRQKGCPSKLIYQIQPETKADKVFEQLISTINTNNSSIKQHVLRKEKFYYLRKSKTMHVHGIQYYKKLKKQYQMVRAEDFIASLTKNINNSYSIKQVKKCLQDDWKISEKQFYHKFYPQICLKQQILKQIRSLEEIHIQCIQLTSIQQNQIFPNILIITPKMKKRIQKYGECLYLHVKKINFKSQDRFFHWGQIYIINQHFNFLQVGFMFLGQKIFSQVSIQNVQNFKERNKNIKTSHKNYLNYNLVRQDYIYFRSSIFRQIFEKFLLQASKIRKSTNFNIFSKQSQHLKDIFNELRDKFSINHFYFVQKVNQKQYFEKPQQIYLKGITLFHDTELFENISQEKSPLKKILTPQQSAINDVIKQLESFLHEKQFIEFVINLDKIENLRIQQNKNKYLYRLMKHPFKYFISQLRDNSENPVFVNNIKNNDIENHIRNRIYNSFLITNINSLQKYFLKVMQYIKLQEKNNNLNVNFGDHRCLYCESKEQSKHTFQLKKKYIAHEDSPRSTDIEIIEKYKFPKFFIENTIQKKYIALQSIRQKICPKVYQILIEELVSLIFVCSYQIKQTKNKEIFYEINYLSQNINVIKISNSQVKCQCNFSLRYGLPCRHQLYICLQEGYDIGLHIKRCWIKQNIYKNLASRRYPLRKKAQ